MMPNTREEWRRFFFAHAPAAPWHFDPKRWFDVGGVRYECLPQNATNYNCVQESALDTEMRWRHEYADRCLAELKILQ